MKVSTSAETELAAQEKVHEQGSDVILHAEVYAQEQRKWLTQRRTHPYHARLGLRRKVNDESDAKDQQERLTPDSIGHLPMSALASLPNAPKGPGRQPQEADAHAKAPRTNGQNMLWCVHIVSLQHHSGASPASTRAFTLSEHQQCPWATLFALRSL